MAAFWLTFLLSFLLDQVTKLWALSYLSRPLVLIPGLLTLRCVHNPGAAFGLLAHQTPLLILVAAVASLVLLLGYKRLRLNAPPIIHWGLGFFLGGTLGNLVDRVRFGYVVDFIDFGFWPVFNLADVAIVVGVGLILWYWWRGR
ncbi:lipoprotein signal peptidase [Ammonifex degensii KC4]|uniref:Lipoprotein signal peptidase n=1 Tax=Ammonifex degensii (strain DSM 10501 / KC4) TaxID=429009 RepID=C9R8S1_AMMDK|nr:signal peptidase II [Ammonifex degensii]ACX52700.1 lipoprotein signal peptidase [Ammonifex degensii KC4]